MVLGIRPQARWRLVAARPRRVVSLPRARGPRVPPAAAAGSPRTAAAESCRLAASRCPKGSESAGSPRPLPSYLWGGVRIRAQDRSRSEGAVCGAQRRLRLGIQQHWPPGLRAPAGRWRCRGALLQHLLQQAGGRRLVSMQQRRVRGKRGRAVSVPPKWCGRGLPLTDARRGVCTLVKSYSSHNESILSWKGPISSRAQDSPKNRTVYFESIDEQFTLLESYTADLFFRKLLSSIFEARNRKQPTTNKKNRKGHMPF